MSRKRERKATNVNSPDNITGDDSTSTKNDPPAPTYTHELATLKIQLQAEKEKGDLRDETIAILKTDKQFLQEELVKKDSFIRELIKKKEERKPGLKASKKSPRIAISSSEEVIDSDESSSLSDSSLEEVKMKKRKHKHKKIALPAADATGHNRVRMRNTRGIIRRYLDTLEAFKKGKSMKAAFDAIGVDRNTIARTAIIAELHLAAPDVLKSMGQWNDKTETLSTFIGKCRSALTTEIKEKITQMKADGDLLPIA